jgi:hypothetical protein
VIFVAPTAFEEFLDGSSLVREACMRTRTLNPTQIIDLCRDSPES